MFGIIKEKWSRKKSPEEKTLKKEKEKIQRDINDQGIQKVIKPTVIILGTIMLASLNNLPKSSGDFYLYHAFLWLIVGSLIALMAVGLAQATILEKKNGNRAIFAIPLLFLFNLALAIYFVIVLNQLIDHGKTIPKPQEIEHTIS